jgi:uncharacterized membrane protein
LRPSHPACLTLATGFLGSTEHNDAMAEREEGTRAEQEEPVPSGADLAGRPSHLTWAQMSRARARHAVDSEWVPAWLRPTGPENRLPVSASIVVVIALQIWLSGRYGLHPRWLLPLLEIALLVVLTAINPVRLSRETRVGRYLSMSLAGLITLDNVVSALVLDYGILTGKTSNDAIGLLSTGAAIYLTNIIVFGIWYWELDRGGPFNRAAGIAPHPDFLFPQMVSPEMGPEHWEPRYLDYLYTSFTNVMAFSPTDTMPLSRWAKSLMALQSAIALSTTALVLARAVNILK